MKTVIAVLIFVTAVTSCDTTRNISSPLFENGADTLIVQSLFSDKAATISEDNISKILDGSFRLPRSMKVAIVKLENRVSRGNYFNYWNDEEYLKSQQSYLDLFIEKLKQSPRVTKVSIIPDLLVSKTPSFTNLREAAVRMQSDVVVVYAITSDIYSKYRLFSKSDIKAYATTQLIILDVRTGLVPFSTIVTKDYLSQKNSADLDLSETRKRIQKDAVLLTINEIGQQIVTFLNTP